MLIPAETEDVAVIACEPVAGQVSSQACIVKPSLRVGIVVNSGVQVADGEELIAAVVDPTQ
jgi:hypothetical protein